LPLLFSVKIIIYHNLKNKELFMLTRFLKPKPLLGLSLHPDEIHLTQLNASQSIEKSASRELPKGAISEGRIRQFEQVKAALQQLVEATQTQGHRVAIALPAQAVISKRLKLSNLLQPEECEIEINNRLNHYLPGIAGAICFDFVILGQSGGSHQDVLLIAARQDQVSEYVEVVSQAGLQAHVVDIDAYAVMRGVQFLMRGVACHVVVIEIAKTLTHVVMFHEQQLIFSQHFAIKNIFQILDELRRVMTLFIPNFSESIICFFCAGDNARQLSELLQAELKVNREHLHFHEKSQIPALTSFGLALRGVAHAQH
jgi:type IV pilus assembly protein PilM